MLGVLGGPAPQRVRRHNGREVVDGMVESCHAKSVGIIFPVDGDVPGMFLLPPFLDQKGYESRQDILPELGGDPSLLRLCALWVSLLPSTDHWASWALSLLVRSSGVMSLSISSLQYRAFFV